METGEFSFSIQVELSIGVYTIVTLETFLKLFHRMLYQSGGVAWKCDMLQVVVLAPTVKNICG